MAASDNLFIIVSTMNRKEKSFARRYLNLYSSGKKSSLSCLFEKLIKYASDNKNYNEEEFKKQLDRKIIRHLPVLKNKLYNLLLNSLCEFNEVSQTDYKVKILMNQFDVLFSKSLLTQCKAILYKAKKIAEEYEMFWRLNEILNKELNLIRYIDNVSDYEKKAERINEEHSLILERIKNFSEMNILRSKFIGLIQKYPTVLSRGDEMNKEVIEMLENPLLKDESKMICRSSQKIFYNLKIAINQWQKDNKEALNNSIKYLNLIEEDYKRNNEPFQNYVKALYAVMISAHRVFEYNDYESAYKKLKNICSEIEDTSGRDITEAFYYLCLSVFSISAEKYCTERGYELLEISEKHYKLFDRSYNIQQKIVWYFVISRFLFLEKDYGSSAKWLNRLIVLPGGDLSQDYQCYARIMNLIVAYESGNVESIEYALRIAFYFLTKKNKIYKYEKIILKYLRQIYRVNSNEELNEIFDLMHKDLSEIYDDPFEQNAFDAFNILEWLNLKIKR